MRFWNEECLQIFQKRLREANKRIESLALMDVYGRVARLLTQMLYIPNPYRQLQGLGISKDCRWLGLLNFGKKMGFGVPVEEWLRKDLKDYGGDMVLSGAASRWFLEAPMLEKFWNEHQSGLRNRSTELWIIMMLNLWQKNFG